MATKVGSLIISLALESGAFRSGLSNADKQLKASVKRMEALGKSMQGLGQKLSFAVTLPLVALGKASVDAALQSADALAQVNASLKSMGNAAGRTTEQLQALAKSEMRKSLFDDDDILRKVTATLLTFGKVSGAAFDQAQQAAIDLSAKLGTDLQASTILVGKALNDPIKGLMALTRAGVSFTAQQKDQIKAMVAVGDLAGAQKIILGELAKEFGGSAEAAAKANPFTQLKHSMEDFKEAVGGVLLKILPPVTKALNDILSAFNNLSPGAQDLAVKLGLIAAVAGPVAYIIGSIATIIAPFTGALSLIAGEGGLLLAVQAGFAGLSAVLLPFLPIIAAVAAAGLLIYSQWDKLAPVFADIGQAIGAAFGPAASELMATIKQAFDDFMGSEALAEIMAFVDVLGNIAVVIVKAFGGAIPGIIKALGDILMGVVHVIIDAVKLVVALLSGDWAGAWQAAKDLVVHAVQGIGGAIANLTEAAVGFIAGMVGGIRDWLGTKLDAVWKWVVDKITWVKDAFFSLYDAVVGRSFIPDMVDGIALHMARLDAVMVDPALSATERTKQAFKQLAEDVQGIMGELFPDARNLADFQTKLDKLNQGIKAGGAGGYSAGQLRAGRDRLIDGAGPDVLAGAAIPLADRLRLIGNPADAARDVSAQLDKLSLAANDNAGEVETANVRIAKSFKDMANETVSRLQDLVGAIKGGGFLDILGAVINIGLQLGSVGAFGKGVQTKINAIPAHAAGTSFAPGGVSLVGERGPELVNLPRGSQVIPNHALRGGGGGNTYNFSGNLLTPEWWAQINAGDVRAAQAGALGGQARVAFANSRRLA